MGVFCLISRDFATCSLALQKHLFSVVVNRLSTSASLARNTLAPLFMFAEWSLFAQGHVTMISFFFRVRDLPLHFHSLNPICSAPIRPVQPVFVYTLQWGPWSIIFQTYGCWKFFRPIVRDESFNFRIFYRAKCFFLSPVWIVSLKMLLYLH